VQVPETWIEPSLCERTSARALIYGGSHKAWVNGRCTIWHTIKYTSKPEARVDRRPG
jgi:hypothetical protein